MKSRTPPRVKRSLLILVALSVSACPTALIPDAGDCPADISIVVFPVTLASPGEVSLRVDSNMERVSDRTISMKVTDDDGGVVATFAERQMTLVNEFKLALAEGAYTATGESRCGNRREQASRTIVIHPRLTLTQSLPRTCQLLQTMGAGRFDCDGVVIDAAGVRVPGWSEGIESRIVPSDAGLLRWVSSADHVRLEREGEVIGEVDMRFSMTTMAAQDFLFTHPTDRAIAMSDGGLSLIYLETEMLYGPDPLVPIAVVSNGARRRMVFRGIKSKLGGTIDSQFVRVCDVVFGATGFSNCEERAGQLVRQDVTSREVLVVDDDRFVSFDPFDVPTTLSTRALIDDVFIWPIAETWQDDGTQFGLRAWGQVADGGGVLGPAPTYKVFTLDSVSLSSSNLVWKPLDGGTRYTTYP